MKDERRQKTDGSSFCSVALIHPSSFILANMDESLRGIAESLRGLAMPELRKDPIVGRWVIIATDRAKRPVGPKAEVPPPVGGYCPFCEGSENNTPFEILA